MDQLQPPGSPGLPGSVHVAPRDRLYDDLAEALLAAGTEAVEARGVFHLALSGGSTPEPFFVRLVIDPRYRLIPWQKAEIWQVDERIVPDHDDQRNLKMIRETLTNHLPIRPRQLHPIPVLASDPAVVYEAELGRAFSLTPSTTSGAASGAFDIRHSPPAFDIPSLDFILLGLGTDGHTASLFPGSPALEEKQRGIVRVDDPGPAVNPRVPRITMTFPLLNAARRLAVLVTGVDKSAILHRIDAQLRSSGRDLQNLPITELQPLDGQLTWWLDSAAVQGPGTAP